MSVVDVFFFTSTFFFLPLSQPVRHPPLAHSTFHANREGEKEGKQIMGQEGGLSLFSPQ